MLQDNSVFENSLIERVTGRIGSTLKEMFTGDFLAKDLMEFDTRSAQIARNLLQGKDAAFGIRQAFALGAEAIASMGGDIKDVAAIQQSILESTQRNILVSDTETFEKIYAAQQLTGQGAERLLRTYKDIGISSFDAAQNVQKGVDKAREMGVNTVSVFEKITQNLSKINEYNFQNGVEGFSRMAAKATALRVDMSDTFNFAEKVMNPEGAIEMANAFQRLGVGTSQLLDPLRLMDLSMNDPEELQNQLAKMTEQFTKFNSETGRFEILPGAKRMLRELSQSTGISYQELSKMSLASAELSDKLGKIKFPDFATKDQQEMIANLSEMKGGEYKVMVQERKDGQTVLTEKAVTQLRPEDIKNLVDANKGEDMVALTKQSNSYQADMVNSLRQIQVSISGGVASSTEGERVMRGVGSLAKNTSEAAKETLISVNMVKNNVDKFSQTITDLISGNKTMSQALDGLQSKFSDLGEDIGKFSTTVKTKIEKDKDFEFMKGGVVEAIVKGIFETEIGKFISKNTSTVTPSTASTQNVQDVIITEKGNITTAPDDIIAAFKQGGIISQTMQNVSTAQLPNTSNISELMMNFGKNMISNMNSSTSSEVEVKFQPMELKITSDGNMDQLRIALQNNPELGQIITKNIQKILGDSLKSTLKVKNYQASPTSIA